MTPADQQRPYHLCSKQEYKQDCSYSPLPSGIDERQLPEDRLYRHNPRGINMQALSLYTWFNKPEPKPKLNIDDLEVVKVFTLMDIYNNNPCHDEFTALLKSRECYSLNAKFNLKEVRHNKVLMQNLEWVVKKGLLRKKQTRLKPGMQLKKDLFKFLVTDRGIFNINNGSTFTTRCFKTLDKLNDHTKVGFEVIKDV